MLLQLLVPTVSSVLYYKNEVQELPGNPYIVPACVSAHHNHPTAPANLKSQTAKWKRMPDTIKVTSGQLYNYKANSAVPWSATLVAQY
ncbi:hypothetical protein PoB_003230800 [Plakobranchus ocellatus]|uniref:Uncharacterized protein n=1 Tax=Plakobranchus ocellatus TaxID=259542 RepID=A0AAV4AGY5_9GAST|nr:hypothetical protein PoB_003230800 [Plakobranchus ocellatus]